MTTEREPRSPSSNPDPRRREQHNQKTSNQHQNPGNNFYAGNASDYGSAGFSLPPSLTAAAQHDRVPRRFFPIERADDGGGGRGVGDRHDRQARARGPSR